MNEIKSSVQNKQKYVFHLRYLWHYQQTAGNTISLSSLTWHMMYRQEIHSCTTIRLVSIIIFRTSCISRKLQQRGQETLFHWPLTQEKLTLTGNTQRKEEQ